VSLNLQIGLLIVVLTGMLLAEWRWGRETTHGTTVAQQAGAPDAGGRQAGENR
jgi:hypothetical protein